jgi:signal transduction histidine kinase
VKIYGLNNRPFIENKDAVAFAQAIVDTDQEPLLLLDKDLRVLAASRSFYQTFKVARTDTLGRLLSALGDGQRDIPKLQLLREKIVPEHDVMEDYEVEHQFPDIGMQHRDREGRKIIMDTMAASIAHEVNQPLGAIVANGNAALRWLASATPDINEARAALKRIVHEGHRVSEVIAGIRLMFQKNVRGRVQLGVNDIVLEVLTMVDLDARTHRVSQLNCARTSHNCLQIEVNCSKFF